MSQLLTIPSKSMLVDRASLLAAARHFFAQRKVMEVDCTLLHPTAPIDTHIDLFATNNSEKEVFFLHSSPEYGMKKLLSQGSGDIYQLSHVFRKGEKGHWHNPEFTLLEWYRIDFSFSQMIDETIDLISLFLGKSPSRRLTYRQAFREYAGLDPFTCSIEELQEKSQSRDADRDALLHHILAHSIEQQLGRGEYVVLTHYPASQAALAQCTTLDGQAVAERFEIYWEGIELANGYHELADPIEQRKRLIEENKKRKTEGKETYPIDEEFLAALERGLPSCCGVAVGFDRLMQLRHQTKTIQEVQF